MALNLLFTASLLDDKRERDSGSTSRQVYLFCGRDRHLVGLPHFGVVDKMMAGNSLAN